jgi:hypothetical protein
MASPAGDDPTIAGFQPGFAMTLVTISPIRTSSTAGAVRLTPMILPMTRSAVGPTAPG